MQDLNLESSSTQSHSDDTDERDSSLEEEEDFDVIERLEQEKE